jgi:hypothetical protein
MQSIKVRGEPGRELYDVILGNGEVVQGLKKGALASYNAFRVAAALQGVFVRLRNADGEGLLETLPMDWQKSHWLRIVAAAIRAGREEAPEPKGSRKTR